MNPREKLIAAAIGVLIAGVVAWFAMSWYFGQLEQRENQLEKLQADVKKKKTDQRNANLAAERLAKYEAQSLPPDAEVAKSLYEQWLLQIASEVEPKLAAPTITAKAPAPVRGIFSRLSFTVKTQAELPQIIDLLYRIQRVDWLHRIDSVSLVPRNDSRLIDVTLTVSALSMRSAPRASKLTEVIAEKYKDTKLADYREPIVNRNFFGAPNRKPQLELPSSVDAVIDRTFELQLKASDPDAFDKIASYTLVESPDKSARLDPKTGKFTWRPKTKGEFAFKIAVTDDGYPNLRSEEKRLAITVKDPPREVARPAKSSFDDAKYTVLTAVIEDTGIAEIWLNVRPKGETRVLQVGDKFEIGSVKGEVSEIGVDDVLLMVDGKLRRLEVGDTLAMGDSKD
jgi:hypothetical protein